MMQNNYRPAMNASNGNLNMMANSNSNNSPNHKPCKKELMDKINQYSFAVNEATLFLDTHPYDAEALFYFEKYRELRVEAMKDYAKYYAPLAIDYAVCDKTPFSWATEPFPWEGVDC